MIESAENVIKKAIETCRNPAISFSFGKDSLVCVDIARKLKPDILIINIDRGDGGDVPEVLDTFGVYLQNANFHRIKTPRSILQIYEESGGVEKVGRINLKKNLLAGIKQARALFNIDCSIMGLRTQESKGRSYLNQYGTFHYSETEKIYLCKPVLNWGYEEIWAYIVTNNLPYLSFYDDEAKYIGYEQARYSNWAGVFLIERGRIAILRMTRPDLFQRLASIFPEVKSYT